jgi:hypothetical protein
MSESTEESVGILEGEPNVSRVIVQDEVKLYRVRATIAYLDGGVFDFGPTSVTFKSNPTPVYNDDNQQIGFADVGVVVAGNSGRRIEAAIAIDYATEERLLAETKSERLYPRLFGSMKMAGSALFDFQARLVPFTLRIDGIQISRRAPADERIVPFGELAL